MACTYFINASDAYNQGFKDGQEESSVAKAPEEIDRLSKMVLMEKLDKVTRLLCYTMKNLNDPFNGEYGNELETWWSLHKLIDREKKDTGEW